jgi:mRNA-degrading endonuclease RelE of RelBE toxin-antitoxin system
MGEREKDLQELSPKQLKEEIIKALENPPFPIFKRSLKKINNRDLLLKILQSVLEINYDYTIGEMKTGNLRGIRTYKFIHDRVSYRLSYYVLNDGKIIITYIDIMKREDSYDNLKKYFQSRKSVLKQINEKGI